MVSNIHHIRLMTCTLIRKVDVINAASISDHAQVKAWSPNNVRKKRHDVFHWRYKYRSRERVLCETAAACLNNTCLKQKAVNSDEDGGFAPSYSEGSKACRRRNLECPVTEEGNGGSQRRPVAPQALAHPDSSSHVPMPYMDAEGSSSYGRASGAFYRAPEALMDAKGMCKYLESPREQAQGILDFNQSLVGLL